MLATHATLASAQEIGTAVEARDMLDRAVTAVKTNEVAALGQFNDATNKEFHDRDLYVFCYNQTDGKITAYSSSALLGIDVRTLALRDDPIGRRAYDAIQNLPEGSVGTIDYNFPKPRTTEAVPMQFFETRVGDQGCGVAYYK